MENIELENINCNICSSGDAEEYISMSDHLLGIPGKYIINKCKNCGHKYLNPRPNQKTVTLLYEKYYPIKDRPSDPVSKMRSNILLRRIYHELTGEFLSEIISKVSGRVLDIGCGQGILLEDLRNRNCDPYGVEINPLMAETAAKKGLSVTCGNIEQAAYPDEYFDYVIMNHTIEHMPDPKSVLNEAKRVLKYGGKIFINCPNINSYSADIFKEYWAGWHIPFHFNYFSVESIKKLSDICGFNIRSVKTATPGYRFFTSLESYVKKGDTKIKKLLNKDIILKNRVSGLILSVFLRFTDLLFPNKGECIYAELQKSR